MRDDVIAFTAGAGAPYESLAKAAADRFSSLNQIEARVLTPRTFLFDRLRSPHWAKAFLWDLVDDHVGTIIWFDADIVPIRALDEWPDEPFCAVPDVPATSGLHPFVHHGAPLRPYLNSGFFIARRDCEPVFHRLAREMAQAENADRFEQSCLNVAVREVLGGFCELPLSWNWFFGFYDRMVGKPPDDIRMVHFVARLRHLRWPLLRRAYEQLGVDVAW